MVGVRRAPGGGQLVVQGGGGHYAHVVVFALCCTMAQGLGIERSDWLCGKVIQNNKTQNYCNRCIHLKITIVMHNTSTEFQMCIKNQACLSSILIV